MKKYNGFEIGQILKQLREDRGLTREAVSEATELSVSSIRQMEYGIRNLSMRSLYLFMNVYDCDANTLLNIETVRSESSIDQKLIRMPREKRDYFWRSFMYMMDEASGF